MLTDEQRAAFRRVYEAGKQAGRREVLAALPRSLFTQFSAANDLNNAPLLNNDTDEPTGYTADDAKDYARYFSPDADGNYHGWMHRRFGLNPKQFATATGLTQGYVYRDGKHVSQWVPKPQPPRTFAAPGPPPRPNLVWKEDTHRWVNPHTGDEHEPEQTPATSAKPPKKTAPKANPSSGTHPPKPPKEPKGKPGSQLKPEVVDRLKALGMVGSLPPADVPLSAIKIADLSKGAEALKFVPLMSWNQTTHSGRVSAQYRYTQEFHDRNAAEKHERVRQLKPHIAKIQQVLEQQMGDPALTTRQREAAAIANTIRETGLRPTDSDESVKHGHFGISSIQARHCTVTGNEVRLEFTGKEGVLNKAVIRDPANVAFIKSALKQAKAPDDFVFREANSTNAGDALKAASVRAGGSDDVKVKDLRTLKAHQIAEHAVRTFAGPPPPLSGDPKADGKLIAKAILEMATQVSGVLNNQPTESRDTYVDPAIWVKWRNSLQEA